jgi:hypothetical protein
MSKGKFFDFADQNGVWTGAGTLSFPKLTEAEAYAGQAGNPDAKKYFSAALHVPKAEFLAFMQANVWPKFEAAIAEVYKGGLVPTLLPGFDTKVNVPSGFKFGWKDGDVTNSEGYPLAAGCVVLNASKSGFTLKGVPRPAPTVYVNANGQPTKITDKVQIMADVYAGCEARLNVSPTMYDSGGGKGLKFELNGVFKVKDGTRIGGGAAVNVDASFAALGLTPATEAFAPDLGDL